MLPELIRWCAKWLDSQWVGNPTRFSISKEKPAPGDPDEMKLDTIGVTFDRAMARKKAREAFRDRDEPDERVDSRNENVTVPPVIQRRGKQ